ncbi:MAG: hypothetical protein KDA89_10615 [Planctomycetaceae bacterium]|nr:hypothetical protein [Planctomycetaceae bacterium]
MWFKFKAAFTLWTVQMKSLLRNEVVDLDPHEYCIGAVFLISIGFVLLSGRR